MYGIVPSGPPDCKRGIEMMKPLLSSSFKKELNIPIYQYISKRRILSVLKLAEAGESYAKAAVDSGFNDYSCFYRIYKKYL